MIRQARPSLLLVHLVQTDYFQHRVGPRSGSLIIVTGDHGLHFPEFADPAR